MTQVQDVKQHAGGMIEAVTVPALSDFRRGIYRWQLRGENAATRMRFTAVLEPDFWVPPLIGPWMIKRKLLEEFGTLFTPATLLRWHRTLVAMKWGS